MDSGFMPGHDRSAREDGGWKSGTAHDSRLELHPFYLAIARMISDPRRACIRSLVPADDQKGHGNIFMVLSGCQPRQRQTNQGFVALTTDMRSCISFRHASTQRRTGRKPCAAHPGIAHDARERSPAWL